MGRKAVQFDIRNATHLSVLCQFWLKCKVDWIGCTSDILISSSVILGTEFQSISFNSSTKVSLYCFLGLNLFTALVEEKLSF